MNKMRIAFIGPGIMPIPSNKWGAVESIIWQYKLSLEKLGHQVDIYNDAHLPNILEPIHNGGYDIVHSHYDEHVPFLNQCLEVPFISTTHFGYIHQPAMWGGYYGQIFKDTLNAPAILALSPAIQDLYLKSGYKGKISYLRNGAEVSKFQTSSKGNGRAICVGKVESRKCQEILSWMCRDKVNIDFVGPLGNARVVESNTVRYLGEWSKDELYSELRNYSTLVLISGGEAAPLVVPEGLAAGLSIVVNDRAAANLDSLHPFISILADWDLNGDTIVNAINNSIKSNDMYRNEIRQYAEDHFDWDNIAKEYIDEVSRLLNLGN